MSIVIAYVDDKRTERLHIEDYKKKDHKGRVFCAFGHPITGKQGTKQVWHYAHLSKQSGDCNRNMGEWHRWWQDRVESLFLEVIIYKIIQLDDGTMIQKKHIADMVNGDDLVIEFQKSVIPAHVIQNREKFYGNMIWVFDCSAHDVEVEDFEGQFAKLKLRSGSKFFLAARKKTFLDFGRDGVLELKKFIDETLVVEIWTLKKFDEKFMTGCLKENCADRSLRKPYRTEKTELEFENILEKFEL